MNQANIGMLRESGWATSLAAFLKNEMRTHSIVYALISLLLAETIVVSWITGNTLELFLYEYLWRSLRATLVLASSAFVVTALYALFKGRRTSAFHYLKGAAIAICRRDIISRYVYSSIVSVVFMAAFLYNKTLIPKLNPFRWDSTFAEWDRFLFGGSQPWELLQPFVGTPAVTIFLDIMYMVWVPLFFLFWCLVFVSARVPADVRCRYWLATVASWIIVGLILAGIFSSAGPCYFSLLVADTPTPYAKLNDYLWSVHQAHLLNSTLAKEYLWSIYSGDYDMPGGISAMPSMHNAQAVLFAAVGYSLDRRLGNIMLAYLVIIFIGSIHLAWHYAVDGIVGAVCALVIWWIAGFVVERHGVSSRSRVS